MRETSKSIHAKVSRRDVLKLIGLGGVGTAGLFILYSLGLIPKEKLLFYAHSISQKGQVSSFIDSVNSGKVLADLNLAVSSDSLAEAITTEGLDMFNVSTFDTSNNLGEDVAWSGTAENSDVIALGSLYKVPLCVNADKYGLLTAEASESILGHSSDEDAFVLALNLVSQTSPQIFESLQLQSQGDQLRLTEGCIRYILENEQIIPQNNFSKLPLKTKMTDLVEWGRRTEFSPTVLAGMRLEPVQKSKNLGVEQAFGNELDLTSTPVYFKIGLVDERTSQYSWRSWVNSMAITDRGFQISSFSGDFTSAATNMLAVNKIFARKNI